MLHTKTLLHFDTAGHEHAHEHACRHGYDAYGAVARKKSGVAGRRPPHDEGEDEHEEQRRKRCGECREEDVEGVAFAVFTKFHVKCYAPARRKMPSGRAFRAGTPPREGGSRDK